MKTFVKIGPSMGYEPSELTNLPTKTGLLVGVNKPIHHHIARKTFASTVLLYNDVPMEMVSELLGHSSIKITQEYYGKVVQKRVSEEMRRIARKIQKIG